MKIVYVFFFTVLLLFSYVDNSFSADLNDDGHVAAIQSRVFHRHHELSMGLGYIPDDNFYYVYPLSIGYTYHFNDMFAWEVARGLLMLTAEKDLKKDLETDFGVTPTVFRKLKYALHSHFIWKPLYGKDVFRDRTVINHETYILGGGGTVIYEKQSSVGVSETEFAPSLSFGVGEKIFINEKFCLNIELRDLVNFRSDKSINNFWFGLSVGYRFNLAARKTAKDAAMDQLMQYLK
jgi:outer membrane beta-barrel protein